MEKNTEKEQETILKPDIIKKVCSICKMEIVDEKYLESDSRRTKKKTSLYFHDLCVDKYGGFPSDRFSILLDRLLRNQKEQ